MLDFVKHFIGKTVVLHTNTENMKMDLLMTAKSINKRGKYAVVANYEKENTSIPMENVDNIMMFSFIHKRVKQGF